MIFVPAQAGRNARMRSIRIQNDRLLSMDILPGRRHTSSQQAHGRNVLEIPMTRQWTFFVVGVLR
jgi:hypothetical protein